MKTKKLIREQLDNKIIKLHVLEDIAIPPSGWIYAIRQALSMSRRQLAQKLSITPQSVKEIEEREKSSTISIKVLKQVASALDMKLVYGFIPKEKTLGKMIESRAQMLARQIVERTAIHMGLEDQSNTQERINMAIKDKSEELIKEMPRILWD